MTHFEDRNENLVQEDFDLFLRSVSDCSPSLEKRGFTFIRDLIDLSMYQKISTLSSKTWFTGLTAFWESDRQRYCLVACRKGVISREELDGMDTSGLVKRSEWDLSIVRTRWRDSSFDRIAWLRRSRSLMSKFSTGHCYR